MRDPSTTHGIAIMRFCVARWQDVNISNLTLFLILEMLIETEVGFLWCYCLCNSVSASAINDCKGNSGRKILNNIF